MTGESSIFFNEIDRDIVTFGNGTKSKNVGLGVISDGKIVELKNVKLYLIKIKRKISQNTVGDLNPA